MGRAKDLTGMRFGRLTVLGLNEEESSKPRGKNGRKVRYYNCLCDCGNEKIIDGRRLTSENTKSCGCLHKEKSSDRMKNLNEKQWQDEEHIQAMRELSRERILKQWQDENFKQMEIDKGKKLIGKNNPNYNSNLTNEEREQGRNIDGYTEWRDEVKRLANFTCDICGDNRGGNLVSHHLDGYDWCKERRMDVTNGVCLCECCHKEFHHIHGYGDNTKEQYEQFKEHKQENSDSNVA